MGAHDRGGMPAPGFKLARLPQLGTPYRVVRLMLADPDARNAYYLQCDRCAPWACGRRFRLDPVPGGLVLGHLLDRAGIHIATRHPELVTGGPPARPEAPPPGHRRRGNVPGWQYQEVVISYPIRGLFLTCGLAVTSPQGTAVPCGQRAVSGIPVPGGVSCRCERHEGIMPDPGAPRGVTVSTVTRHEEWTGTREQLRRLLHLAGLIARGTAAAVDQAEYEGLRQAFSSWHDATGPDFDLAREARFRVPRRPGEIPVLDLDNASDEEKLAWVKARAAAGPWHQAVHAVARDRETAGIRVSLAGARAAQAAGEAQVRRLVSELTLAPPHPMAPFDRVSLLLADPPARAARVRCDACGAASEIRDDGSLRGVPLDAILAGDVSRHVAGQHPPAPGPELGELPATAAAARGQRPQGGSGAGRGSGGRHRARRGSMRPARRAPGWAVPPPFPGSPQEGSGP